MSQSSQLTLAFEYRPAYDDDHFVVAPCNEVAVSWIDRWPDWPSPYLIIHGPAGCGKTHLSEVFRRRADAKVLTHRALAENCPRDPEGAGGGWIVEDADSYLFNGEPEPLFHFLNQVLEGQGQLLLSAREAPSQWRVDLADLRSRINAAPAVAIGPPDDELLAAVLMKHFTDRQLRVGIEVVDYAVKRMERSFDAVRELVDRLDRQSLSARREITVPLVRQVFLKTDLDGK